MNEALEKAAHKCQKLRNPYVVRQCPPLPRSLGAGTVVPPMIEGDDRSRRAYRGLRINSVAMSHHQFLRVRRVRQCVGAEFACRGLRLQACLAKWR